MLVIAGGILLALLVLAFLPVILAGGAVIIAGGLGILVLYLIFATETGGTIGLILLGLGAVALLWGIVENIVQGTATNLAQGVSPSAQAEVKVVSLKLALMGLQRWAFRMQPTFTENQRVHKAVRLRVLDDQGDRLRAVRRREREMDRIASEVLRDQAETLRIQKVNEKHEIRFEEAVAKLKKSIHKVARKFPKEAALAVEDDGRAVVVRRASDALTVRCEARRTSEAGVLIYIIHDEMTGVQMAYSFHRETIDAVNRILRKAVTDDLVTKRLSAV